MKRLHKNLRIERLEDRVNPSPFVLPNSVTAGGAKWFVSNNAPATSPYLPPTNRGLGIGSAQLAGPPSKADAYDGAFVLGVDGTTFQDPTGIVDLTGTAVTANSETLSGLTTTVQYYFLPNSATVRAIYSFSNPSASPISTVIDWENGLGSDATTTVVNSSSGDAAFDAGDRWFITSDGNPAGDPVLSWVRYGPGAVQTPSSSPQIPGVANPTDKSLFTDEYDLTVPAGQTKYLMFFGQLSTDAASAATSVAAFDSDATMFSAGFLAGLTPAQEAQIVNWQFPAVTSPNATTFTEGDSGSTFSVTSTSPETAALSEAGALPAGVSFTDNGDGTATLHGTPNYGTSGSYPITITAAIGSGPAATQDFTLTVNPATVTHFLVSAPPTATAGTAFGVTVSALDQFNGAVSDYTGTVHFTETDSGAGSAVPADYTFVAGDDGTHTFTNGVTFVTAGSQTITATDTATSSITGTSNAIDVSAAAATHFAVSAPPTATAGTAFDFTVTALDAFDNTATGYTGTVHFTSTDGSATLPVDSILATGTGTFSATLDTAGSQTLTATDTVTSSVTGTSNAIDVSAAAASQFSVSAPPSSTAGTAFDVTVTALDPFGNTDPSYAGTIHFTTSDIGAGSAVPGDYTFVAGDDGEHTFTNGVTFVTAGSQTLTATDNTASSITGTSNAIDVSAAAATHLSVSAPPAATAGTAFDFTVTALDAFENAATGYAGTVHFTQTDSGSGAAVPGDYTFVAGDNGSHTFTNGATFVTVGSQTLTATDTVTTSITGTSNAIDVSAAAATHFTVSVPGTATAGTAFNFTVTALDAFDNAATDYTGTVHFTSTDGSAILPVDSTLTSGTGTFSATLDTAGSQTLTATDTTASSITGTSNSIAVSAAAASHFSVSASPAATAGTAFDFTVTALDPFDNTDPNYVGTVHFTASDSGAGSAVPGDYTFVAGDDGTHTFADGATLVTAGNQTITATDTVTSSITGTSNAIAVSAAAATHFTVSAPSPATAGTAFNFTVTALDAFDNTAASYAGTVHFTSTDGSATLPVDSTLASGTGTFSATLDTIGSQTITATDTVTSSITGTSNAITVSATAATHFTVSAPSTATAGTAFNFTITALDAFDNTVTSYAGTVHFTSTDGSATLPADSTLTSGVGTFSATLDTAGSQTITATDTVTSSITGASNAIAVSAAAATHFSVSAPSTATAGTAFNFTVTALDAFNNTAASYAGTVHFTSTDGSATLPADSTLTSGAGTLSATLKLAGSQTITATDTVTASITGTSNSIAVSAAAATHFTVSAPATATAGTSFNFTVTALDAFNNTATGYAGSVHFSSTSILATLPANSTLASGTGTFPATLFTAGSRTITATDAATASITGTSGAIAVAIVGVYAVGSGPGASPSVIVYDSGTMAVKFTLSPFEPGFTGGVHVSIADVNGDGIEDIIVGAGNGGGPQVQVFSGKTGLQLPGLIGSFFAYSPGFRGGVTVAGGDINGDGFADIVTGTGNGGGPQVTVFSGANGNTLRSFFAYSQNFRGGVSVAVGDVNGDGAPDIITGAGKGGGPQVTVFSGANGAVLKNYFAFDVSFRGGVNVASGDVNNDGFADIVAGAGPGGGPQMTAISGKDGSTLYNFYAFNPRFTGGINVAAPDVNDDGFADIFAGSGVGGGPHATAFSGKTGSVLLDFFPFDASTRGGVYVGGD